MSQEPGGRLRDHSGHQKMEGPEQKEAARAPAAGTVLGPRRGYLQPWDQGTATSRLADGEHASVLRYRATGRGDFIFPRAIHLLLIRVKGERTPPIHPEAVPRFGTSLLRKV